MTDKSRDAIFGAIRRGDLESVEKAVGGDAQAVNEPDEGNMSPLHIAVKHDKPEIVAWLVAHGANLEAVDTAHGATPLGWAAYLGKTDVARILLEAGADVKRPNSYGKTPFQVAEMGAEGDWEKYTGIKREAYKPMLALLKEHGG
jgi:ankyrin repeat protein